ncbi:MAG: hypothetical protein WCK76_13520 [Elusimicrobiota bacterium]
MTKNRVSPFFALSAYFALSLLSTAFSLLLGLSAVRLGGLLGRLALGAARVSRLTQVPGDAAVFSLVCALTALAQYYLVSLLALCRFGGVPLAAGAGAGAFLSCLFFWRAAGLSGLGAYGFSGLPVLLAALIGACAAMDQKPEENPWPAGCLKFLSRFL